jgi:uroporphyrinogen-III synthase
VSRDADLAGTTVILTRAREDSAALASALRSSGADVIELPCVRTEPLDDTAELRDVIAGLGRADLLVLTSRAGADAVATAMPREGLACDVAAVGHVTADRARSLGMRVSFVASRADGHTLARELPLPQGEVVLARSDLADAGLPLILRARGGQVREVTAYRTIAQAVGDTVAVRTAIESGRTVIVVASPSSADALADAIDAAALRQATFVAIGPRSADRVLARVGTVAMVADAPGTDAVIRAIRSREEAIP